MTGTISYRQVLGVSRNDLVGCAAPWPGVPARLWHGEQAADGFQERPSSCPGEPHDEGLVDVGEPGMCQVVAQVVQVRPGPVGPNWLASGCGIGECFVSGGDPQPVQHPPVVGVVMKPG